MRERTEKFNIQVDGNYVPVEAFYRSSRRSLSLTYDPKKQAFKVYAPSRYSREEVLPFLLSHAPSLKKRADAHTPPPGITNDYFYLFGEQYGRGGLSDKQLDRLLRDKLMEFLVPEVDKYKPIMGITRPYEIKIRKMTTRWGVNNLKGPSLTFALSLAHYSQDIIRATIIHELAHDKVRNHGPNFYKIVYRYCPDYKQLERRKKDGHYK